VGGRQLWIKGEKDGEKRLNLASACATALIERNPRNVGNCGTIN
jgi:hypothetical protein